MTVVIDHVSAHTVSDASNSRRHFLWDDAHGPTNMNTQTAPDVLLSVCVSLCVCL